MRVVPQADDKWGIYEDEGTFHGGLSLGELWSRFPSSLDAAVEQTISLRVAENPMYAIAYAVLVLAKALKAGA